MKEVKKVWLNASTHKCAETHEILSNIFYCVGKLPNSKTPKTLSGTTAGQLLDFAEKVAEDDNLWNSFPEQMIPMDKFVAKKEARLRELGPDSPFNGRIKPAIKEYKKGFSKKELREKLRKFLASSK